LVAAWFVAMPAVVGQAATDAVDEGAPPQDAQQKADAQDAAEQNAAEQDAAEQNAAEQGAAEENAAVASTHAADEGVDPPPNPAAGERSDGRLDLPPKRRWRLLPQILLFPFRALFWGLSYPVGFGVRYEDRKHPLERLGSFLTWSDGQRGLRPAFYYSTIYIPEFGLRYFDHLTLGVDTNLSVVATVGGARYVYSGLTVEPTRRSDPIGVVFDVLFDRRADLLYNGLGSHTDSNAANGRYLMNALEARLSLRIRPRPWFAFYATIASGLKRFGNGDNIGGDMGIDNVYDTGTIPGFTHGTSFVRASAGGVLDLRNDRAKAAVGIFAQATFDYTHGIDGDFASYERLRALVGVPINLWARSHVLWLQAATALAWPDVGNIPFSELPTLGGPYDLRGFRFQDFRDYSALWFSAEYRWPIWMWLDGAVFVDYGGVFQQNYGQFGARRMQPDVGVALHVMTAGSFSIGVQLGYGFGEGFNFSIAGTGP